MQKDKSPKMKIKAWDDIIKEQHIKPQRKHYKNVWK